MPILNPEKVLGIRSQKFIRRNKKEIFLCTEKNKYFIKKICHI
jgi:hypothetical protein